jgi:hypothetical protein
MFRVVWPQEALDELVRIWVKSDTSFRNAITAASNEIDRTLADNPQDMGESRVGSERICFIFPLGFRFEVDRGNKMVRLLQLWSFQKRK